MKKALFLIFIFSGMLDFCGVFAINVDYLPKQKILQPPSFNSSGQRANQPIQQEYLPQKSEAISNAVSSAVKGALQGSWAWIFGIAIILASLAAYFLRRNRAVDKK